jgi:DNA-directed RNA polymerase specialized sigma subunit
VISVDDYIMYMNVIGLSDALGLGIRIHEVAMNLSISEGTKRIINANAELDLATKKLQQTLGRKPTYKEITDYLQITLGQASKTIVDASGGGTGYVRTQTGGRQNQQRTN